jgi:hypothetical protein
VQRHYARREGDADDLLVSTPRHERTPHAVSTAL